MKVPKLSISVPVFNGEDHIGDLLESIHKQTFTDFQVMMVDNASTDRTGQICLEYAQKDPRFHYVCNAVNLGLSYSYFRNAFGNSSPYWVYAPADLIWEPRFAQEAIELLDKDPSVGIVYPQVSFIDESGAVREVYRDVGDFQHHDPAERYLNVLRYMGWCTAFLGISRYVPYVQSYLSLMSMFVEEASGDNALLAIMALRTRFVQLEKPLFKRRLGAHQLKAESLAARNLRLYSLGLLSGGRGIRLPFLNFIKHHCEVVVTSSLPVQRKDDLVRQTVGILMERYGHLVKAEVNRAVSLIKRGLFKNGWEDDIDEAGPKLEDEAPAGRYTYLDFAYLSRLSGDLDYALGLLPKQDGLNLGRALVLINLGRQQEALAALAAELLVNPTERQTLELHGQLSALIKKRGQHEISTAEKQ